MRFFSKILLATLFFAIQAKAHEEFAWIQYIDHNQLSARFITTDAQCPNISIDNKSHKMFLRAEQYDQELKEKIKVCEYDFIKANEVSINNIQLKLPPKKINRFIVMGDTGCENSIFEHEHQNQNCSDKNSWPFEIIANKIVELKPDFVIHMGDYAYKNHHDKKDQTAIEKNKKIQWFLFKTEFFQPAKNLLTNIPMVFVRGNHEKCSSAGLGWYAFLDPFPYNHKCLNHSPSYRLYIDDLNLVVVDSAHAKSGKDYSPEDLKHYQERFTDATKHLSHAHWLLIHHPVLGIDKLSQNEPFPNQVRTKLIEQAFAPNLAKKLPVVISAHYHLTAYLEDKNNKLQQLIIGNGGSSLNKSKESSYKLANGLVGAKYGYTQFDRIDTHNWQATAYGIDGTSLFSVKLSTKD